MFDENREEIYTGQISLALFQFSGVWEPVEWRKKWKFYFYRVYSFFIVTLYLLFTCSCSMQLFQKQNDSETFALNLFYSATMLMSALKIATIFKKREIFLKTQEMLVSEICRPRDVNEIEILRNYSLRGRKLSINYAIAVNITGTLVFLSSLATLPNVTLPMPSWSPFSLESTIVFSLSYVHQLICIIVTININVGMETLAMSILLQMCGQLEILIYRLGSLSKLSKSIDDINKNIHHDNNNINNFKLVQFYEESKITRHCIMRHLYIHTIGENINKQFGISIFMQFFASTIILCIIIYNLSKMSLTNYHSWLMISCAGSYTLQIFIYCYFGQQMSEKSAEIGSAIYFLNWSSLTIRTKKSLIILMIRSVRPIKLTASSIIVMSLETFMKIVKTSYSGYNLLKNN